MRICYVANLASVHTERWIRYFAERGHEVHVITPKEGLGEAVPGVHTYLLKSIRGRGLTLNLILNGLLAAPRAVQYRRLLRRIRPDLVHAHYLNDAAFFAMLSRVRPFVATAWGSDVLMVPRSSRLVAAALKVLVRACDLVTCDAEHMKATLVRLGADPEKVKVVFFGTDTQEFNPRQRRPDLRDHFGWADRPVVISTRRLEPIYDVGALLAAIPLVASKFPGVHWVLVGSGSEERKLRQTAFSLGISDQVAFVGEILPHALPGYLASADIYVSTSLSDGGLAASTAEAMACGLPVVVTDVADNRQWIQESVNGLLFPASDSQAIADRIIRLLEDPALRRTLGQNGRRLIEARNNWYVQMGEVEQLYLRLVEPSR